eukprot:1113178-Lingulodinium_polyedra.AAC.1
MGSYPMSQSTVLAVPPHANAAPQSPHWTAAAAHAGHDRPPRNESGRNVDGPLRGAPAAENEPQPSVPHSLEGLLL